MACYHFTIKTDKKPDGTAVKAMDHICYIDREGKYKDIDNRVNLPEFCGNLLGPPNSATFGLNEDKYLMYQSPFGHLKKNGSKIDVSKNASIETLCIALSATIKKHGNEIHVEGSDDFKRQAIFAAVEMDLPIKFLDADMERKKTKLKEQKINDRRSTENRNADDTESRSRDGAGVSKHGIFKSYIEQYPQIPPPQRRHCLHTLSSCPMVQYAEGAELLLQGNVSCELDNKKTNSNSNMRWHLSDERKQGIDAISNNVIDLEKKRSQLLASDHVDYINRDQKFIAKGGCVYQNHHLPRWANHSPKLFFDAADQYEGVGYCRYKEIEFALPNELNLEQQKEIINKFLENHLKDFYYAYAIHDKIGVMSNGQHNTHVHIMFSERKLDEREKTTERENKEFFARPSKTANGKEVGGCYKDKKWNGRDRAKYLCLMRKDFAMIQNETLEKYGFDIRVDHRSLKAQRKIALANGDLKLAELLNRMPEEHIGPNIALQKNHDKVIALEKYRNEKYEYRQLLYAAELLEQNINKSEMVNQKDKNTSTYSALSRSETFASVFDSSNKKIHSLKIAVIDALKEVHALNNVAIWNDEAVSLAKEKFMMLDEREIYQQIREHKKSIDDLTNFEKNLKKPATWNHEPLVIYHEIKKEIEQTKTRLSSEMGILTNRFKPIAEKLNAPAYKENIQKETMSILNNNKHIKAMLNVATETLNKTVAELQAGIADLTKEMVTETSKPKDFYTATEIAKVLQASHSSLEKEITNDKKLLQKLKNKVISLPRAKEMALDVYTNHAFKEIREKQRILEKERPRIEAAKAEFEKEKAAFNALPVPKWYSSKVQKNNYLAEQSKIAEMEAALHLRKEIFSSNIEKLNFEKEQLEKKCADPLAIAKITEITTGILRKNKPIADRYETLLKKHKTTQSIAGEIKTLQKGVNQQIIRDKNSQTKYKVMSNAPAHFRGTSSPMTIAKALNGNAQMARLVAYSYKDEAERRFENSAKSRIDQEVELDTTE